MVAVTVIRVPSGRTRNECCCARAVPRCQAPGGFPAVQFLVYRAPLVLTQAVVVASSAHPSPLRLRHSGAQLTRQRVLGALVEHAVVALVVAVGQRRLGCGE